MININTADLNLLRVFVVIFEEKSATGAAQRLNLTQSAVSLNLRRLREMYQDSLFTRTGRGLAPTTRKRCSRPLHGEPSTTRE